MRTILSFLLIVCATVASAQSSDPNLDKRLNEYLRLNRELNFSQLIEYIHPSLYKIVPKEDILKAFEEGFENDDLSITIDSASVKNIGPVFSHEAGKYHKVDYFLVMSMKFKDTEMLADTTFRNFMTSNLQATFPSKEVKFLPATNTFTISGMDVLVAIKDSEKDQWLFVGYDRSKAEMMNTILPQAVIQQFKLN